MCKDIKKNEENKIFLIEIYGGAVSELTKDCE